MWHLQRRLRVRVSKGQLPDRPTKRPNDVFGSTEGAGVGHERLFASDCLGTVPLRYRNQHEHRQFVTNLEGSTFRCDNNTLLRARNDGTPYRQVVFRVVGLDGRAGWRDKT
jgi:hypothetical protein